MNHFDQVAKLAQDLQPELVALSTSIHDHPEMGHQETFAADAHCALLEKYGFTVERPFCGLPTAFKATYSSQKPGPTIGFLAEYDALPGIGHGCGHNILGATSTGSGIVLREMIDQLGGTVIVFGTPAEETDGGKVAIVNAGGFDGVDVAMMAHPSDKYYKSGTSLGIVPLRFEFFGQTAHAAAAPEKGANALHGVISLFNNIAALREHFQSDARVHGVILDGGKAANVVPDYTRADCYVRAATKPYLNKLVEQVKNCAQAAALSNGVTVKISNFEAIYDNMVTNETLSNQFTQRLLDCGVPEVIAARPGSGSSDAGNVSQVCPMIHPHFAISQEACNSHTVEFAAASVTDFANEQMAKTVRAFALTAADIIENPQLLADITAEFRQTMGL